jgi:hypothetical protein
METADPLWELFREFVYIGTETTSSFAWVVVGVIIVLRYY